MSEGDGALMSKTFVEQCVLPRAEIAEDIACHLMVRLTLGKAMVIVDSPRPALSNVRRQWMKLGRALQRERARTLDSALIRELTRQMEAIQALQFVAKTPREVPEADVFFVTADSAKQFMTTCRTVYWFASDTLPDVAKIAAGTVLVTYSPRSTKPNISTHT